MTKQSMTPGYQTVFSSLWWKPPTALGAIEGESVESTEGGCVVCDFEGLKELGDAVGLELMGNAAGLEVTGDAVGLGVKSCGFTKIIGSPFKLKLRSPLTVIKISK